MHQLELRRQIAHLLYGPLILTLYHFGIINLHLLLGAIIGGSIVSLMIRHKKLSPIAKVLQFFERDHHMECFPGKGMLFFTIGAYLTLLFFPKDIAYASIMILSVGDALSNVIGRHFGKTKTRLNPNKYIEGNIIGILASAPVAYLFFPNLPAVIIAATVSMFLEIPNISLFNFEIDDNLIIPLGAGFTMSLFI